MLRAEDSRNFDIIPVAELASVFIKSVLSQEKGGVLVHCYGGVNRSGAVCAAFLVKELAIPFCETVQLLRSVRGTVLTNPSFVWQLVQHCTRTGAKLE